MKRRSFLKNILVASLSAPLIVRSALDTPKLKVPTESEINAVIDSLFRESGEVQDLKLYWVGSRSESYEFASNARKALHER